MKTKSPIIIVFAQSYKMRTLTHIFMLINLHGSHHKFDKFTNFFVIIKITTVAESKYVKEQNYYKSS